MHFTSISVVWIHLLVCIRLQITYNKLYLAINWIYSEGKYKLRFYIFSFRNLIFFGIFFSLGKLD